MGVSERARTTQKNVAVSGGENSELGDTETKEIERLRLDQRSRVPLATWTGTLSDHYCKWGDGHHQVVVEEDLTRLSSAMGYQNHLEKCPSYFDPSFLPRGAAEMSRQHCITSQRKTPRSKSPQLTIGLSDIGSAPRSAISVPGCMVVVSTKAAKRRQHASPRQPSAPLRLAPLGSVPFTFQLRVTTRWKNKRGGGGGVYSCHDWW